jgi:hypothetical protein
MQPRRSLRLVAGALVLALPLLGSCGFGKATDRVYTPGVGTNDRTGEVKVLAAVLVAAQPDSGTFLASLVNNSSTKAVELTEVKGAGEWQDLTIGEIDPPIEVVARGAANLVNEAGITVTGDFEAGDFVELTLSFDNGDSVTMDLPVVYACDEYDGLDTSAETFPSPGPQTDDSASPSAEPTDATTPSPGETAQAAPVARQEPYDCVSALGE